MKETIKSYLQGPRPYLQGVNLYLQYGDNLMLKATFRRANETDSLRLTLYEELRKLAGVSEEEFRDMRRMAERPSAAVPEIPTPELKSKTPAELQNGNKQAAPVVQNVIRFRERFPFLNESDCPDVLKILVADMFAAYDTYVKTYNAIIEAPDDTSQDEILLMAATTVENYLEDRTIFAELEHYRDNKELLGIHPRVASEMMSANLSDTSDIDLMKLAKNAASNVSKWKKKLAEAETENDTMNAQKQLERWETTKTAAEAELEKRKKN